MRTIAVGDIHGCYDALNRLLIELEYTVDDKIVFLGDYIDRGKQSYEVITKLISMKKENPNVIILKGNHEDLACDAQASNSDSLWNMNGGNHTKKSFYKNGASKYSFNSFFRNLPLKHETDTHIFCHSGCLDDLLWGRDDCKQPTDKVIIHGHTPSSGISVVDKHGRINIDSGCVFGFKLCAYILEEDKFVYVDKEKMNERSN